MKIRSHTFTIVIAGVVGFMAIALVTEHYLRTSAESALADARITYGIALGNQERTFNRAFMWYGTVVSVRPDENRLEIELLNRFDVRAPRFRASLHVKQESTVYRQVPLRRGESLAGFTERELSSLRTVTPGERIAAIIRLDENGELYAETLIIGGAL